MARGFDQLTRAPRARVRGTKGSTSCPGRLGTWSEGLRCRPAIPGNSGPCPKASGLLQLSRGTRDRARGPMGSTSCPGPGAPVRRSMVSTSCPRRLKRCSTGLQGRPPEPGDSRIGPRSHGVYQLSQATPSRFPGPTVLTSSRGRLILGSDGPWGCPELRGDSRPCPRARGVDQMSRETFARVKVVRGRPAVPPESGPGPKPRGVDQLSRVTRARV